MNFYRAYLSNSLASVDRTASAPLNGATNSRHSDEGLDLEQEARILEAQVRAWSPATHAMWAIWGIVQAREDLEQVARAKAGGERADEPEFDYLGYSRCRLECFRREIGALGL